MRITTFSPYTVGRVETRRSICLPLTVTADAPVLRDPALGDVDVGHDLQRLMTPGLDRAGRAHHLVEHAVDAVADPQVLLARLDVDVGRAVRDRLRDEQVDELDDRRVLGDRLEVVEVDVLSPAPAMSSAICSMSPDMAAYLPMRSGCRPSWR
jgi:hypothetical protein